MKRLLLLAILLCTAPLFAAIPPDLAELTKQIEQFPATKTEGSDSDRLTRFFDLYWKARMRVLPDEAAYIGYVGVDDRLPDYSPEMLALRHRLPHIELTALASIDRSRLGATEQTSYDLAKRRFELEIEGERFFCFDPFRSDYLLVDQMNDSVTAALGLINYALAKTVADYEKMLTRLRAFPALVDQGIAQLNEGLKRGITPPRITLRSFLAPDPALQDDDPAHWALGPFTKIPQTIPAAERERLSREAAEVMRRQVVPAYRKYSEYLAKTYVPHARESTSMSDMPDGKAWYAYQLRWFTTTDLTPEQIHQLGLDEVKRIRGEMEKVIASTGFKGDFQQFANYLRTDPKFFYTNADELVAAYRDAAKRIDPELIKFFSRLPRLPYGVKAMGEGDGSASAPSALYGNGSLAAGRPGYMLINTYDLKARPKWSIESLTAHEAVPGHHLQYALVEELGELPEWRRWYVFPVFSEGWGLYAERLAQEMGMYKDPYQKFGQLNNEIWRAMRLVLDTGLHVKGWTRQQAIEYCRANSAKTEREIENEVDRYIVHPGSVPCYKIGELKILELRHYAEKELGAKFDIRAFHDEILGRGQLPLDLLEKNIKAWVAARR